MNFLIARQIGGLKHLQIEADRGVVTLRGIVNSYYHKQLCGSCSQRVAGVIRLVNAIQVPPWPGR